MKIIQNMQLMTKIVWLHIRNYDIKFFKIVALTVIEIHYVHDFTFMNKAHFSNRTKILEMNRGPVITLKSDWTTCPEAELIPEYKSSICPHRIRLTYLSLWAQDVQTLLFILFSLIIMMATTTNTVFTVVPGTVVSTLRI